MTCKDMRKVFCTSRFIRIVSKYSDDPSQIQKICFNFKQYTRRRMQGRKRTQMGKTNKKIILWQIKSNSKTRGRHRRRNNKRRG